MTPDERKRFATLNTAWRAGGKIGTLRHPYNSLVSVALPDGTVKTGWIVGAIVQDPEPIYTLEARDGTGDFECSESAITLIQR